MVLEVTVSTLHVSGSVVLNQFLQPPTSMQELTINLPKNPWLRGMSHHHHDDSKLWVHVPGGCLYFAVAVFQTISQSEDEGASLHRVSDHSGLPSQEASPRSKGTQAYKVRNFLRDLHFFLFCLSACFLFPC